MTSSFGINGDGTERIRRDKRRGSRPIEATGTSQAFGHHVGSDRFVQAGLDALLADVDAPSLALLAGLGRREEHEARELFDHVVDELGLGFEVPADPIAARWALAYWLAAQIVDGSLDPATGADLIRVEAARELGYPNRLQPIVDCASELDDWNASWSTPLEQLKGEVVVAARALVARGGPESAL